MNFCSLIITILISMKKSSEIDHDYIKNEELKLKANLILNKIV